MKILFTKSYNIFCLSIICFILSSCGYTMMGTTASNYSVLGDGNKTIAISKMETATLTPWVAYELRSKIHSEMQMRQYAKWADIKEADYLMEVNLTSFETRAYISDDEDETLLNLVVANLLITIYDRNNNLVWSSGSVNFGENYENYQDVEAINDILKELVYIAYDRMQNTF